MVAQASRLRWRAAFQCPVFAAQVVVTLEELRLCIERGATLGKTARFAVQRHDVLAERPIESLQQRSRDLGERDQLRDADNHAPGHRDQAASLALLDHLSIPQTRIRHDLRLFRAATPFAFDGSTANLMESSKMSQCLLNNFTSCC